MSQVSPPEPAHQEPPHDLGIPAAVPALLPAGLPATIPTALPTSLPQMTNASIGIASVTATDEIAKLVPAGGGGSFITVVLALIAVGGGGAAWKFYSQRSKEKHEERLKEIEVGAGSQNDLRQSCDANASRLAARCDELAVKQSELVQKTNELDSKVAEVKMGLDAQVQASREASSGSLSFSGDLDDVKERLEKLEKVQKKPAPKTGAKRPR